MYGHGINFVHSLKHVVALMKHLPCDICQWLFHLEVWHISMISKDVEVTLK